MRLGQLLSVYIPLSGEYKFCAEVGSRGEGGNGNSNTIHKVNPPTKSLCALENGTAGMAVSKSEENLLSLHASADTPSKSTAVIELSMPLHLFLLLFSLLLTITLQYVMKHDANTVFVCDSAVDARVM